LVELPKARLVGNPLQPSSRRPSSLWEEYRRLSGFSAQRHRLIPQVLVYGCFGAVLLFGVFTPPFIPFRGSVSEVTDRLIVFISVLSFLVLTFFVVDETRLCEQFIRRLTDLCCRNRTSETEMRMTCFSIDLIAKRTQVVGRLIDYPFIILLILIVGRIRLFDNWDIAVGSYCSGVSALGMPLSAAFCWAAPPNTSGKPRSKASI
jgi:hypothetical protein